MKGFSRKSFTKSVATILTAVMITVIAGVSVTAFAAGSVDVTDFGVNGRDTSDDTNAIQSVLNNYDNVYIPDGTYYINVNKSLNLHSGQTLTLSEGAVLKALPTSYGFYSIINIGSADDVTVTGGQLIGERADHNGTSGEWGMGINIGDSSNVKISDVTISDCWGDGIYIGGNQQPSRDITIDGVICDNNRRQGLSITYAIGVEISDSVFKNTNGTAPAAGIDIEPNENETTENITIINTECYGNEGAGLDLMGWLERVTDVTVIGCNFSDNAAYGIRIVNAGQLQFEDTDVTNNEMGISIQRDASEISFYGMVIDGNEYRGVALITTSQETGTSDISFESCEITNNSQSSANNQDGIRIDNWDGSAYIRNVTFTDCRFADDQSSRTQRYGLTVGFGSGIYNVVVGNNCTFYGNISGAYLGGNALEVL